MQLWIRLKIWLDNFYTKSDLYFQSIFHPLLLLLTVTLISHWTFKSSTTTITILVSTWYHWPFSQTLEQSNQWIVFKTCRSQGHPRHVLCLHMLCSRKKKKEEESWDYFHQHPTQSPSHKWLKINSKPWDRPGMRWNVRDTLVIGPVQCKYLSGTLVKTDFIPETLPTHRNRK